MAKLNYKDLQAGKIYTDKYGERVYRYKGIYGGGNLSEFDEMEYSEENQDYEPNGNTAILTPVEVEYFSEL